MFTDFFLGLRASGIPVSFKAYLTLQRALYDGLITSLDSFYSGARAILVKSERYFDTYDRIFEEYFDGGACSFSGNPDIDEETFRRLDAWLKDPAAAAEAAGIDPDAVSGMTPDELTDYFGARLADQKERHDYGSKWIGTAGTSPVGHSGYGRDGMRVGGVSSGRSALKVAASRRYRDYSASSPITGSSMPEALKRLRRMVPHGPRDRLDLDETLRSTMRNFGEIELVFRQGLRDRLKVILAIDNGGVSMDPYVGLVKNLFDHSNSLFRDLRVYYFHNSIYDKVWKDPERRSMPVEIDRLVRGEPETRLVIVGDASMSPYELLYRNGAIDLEHRTDAPGLEYLKLLRKNFRHSVWLNPVREYLWEYTRTIGIISGIFPMYEVTLDGLEKAVSMLMSK